MIEGVNNDTKARMEGAIESLKHEFSTIRTGRASLSIVDDIRLDYYGTPTPLNQVATLSIPDGRTIAIQPWESKMVGAIEKAIQKSDIGINPTNDGKMIRLNIPPLTEERRKEFVKRAKAMGEDAKVAMRNIRREANDTLRKAEKDKLITEDELKRAEQEVQKITDGFVARVDDVFKHKEEEIMEV
jgi:ribosome recycling factor